jgi:hypothetical protein
MSTDSGGTQVSSTPSPLMSPSQASQVHVSSGSDSASASDDWCNDDVIIFGVMQGHMYGFSAGVSGSMPTTPSAAG